MYENNDITTGRDCGLAEWINIFVILALKYALSTIFYNPLTVRHHAILKRSYCNKENPLKNISCQRFLTISIFPAFLKTI